MRIARYLALPLLIGGTGLAYLFLNGGKEIAGGVMMIVFALAAGFFAWVLLPTLDHEGNTAPIDPDFEDPGR